MFGCVCVRFNLWFCVYFSLVVAYLFNIFYKMVYSCCVPDCKDYKSVKHRIPIEDNQVYHTWITRIGRTSLMTLKKSVVHERYRVCNKHFNEYCFVPNTNKKKLKVGSLPTVLLPAFSGSNTIETCMKDNQMESTENTETQILLETIKILVDDGAENDSSENIIEESISIPETAVRRDEKGLGVKRKHEEDDDVEMLDLKTDIVNSDVEVGLPLKDCCAHHQDRIKELEHQLKICHEVINTFIMKTEVELEINKIDRPEDQFSQKRWKHEIDLLKMQNNQLLCEVKFMKIKEENFQSRLDHLLHLLNTERDNQNQLKATRSREQSRWNTLRNRLEKTIEEKENECTTIKERETKLNVSLKKKEMRCVKLLTQIKSLNEKLQKEEQEPCRYCGL